MSAQPLPNHVLMREVAKVVINEEMARVAADRELAAEMARLRERVDEFDGIVPPELAEQVKSAIHLLHESPPIVQPRSVSPLPPRRVRRIERTDNGGFEVIDDEAQA